jgi:leucyl aminopeptidase
MIAASARKYAKSGNSKLDKSIIVSEIIHALHQKAAAANDSDYNDCCFVKQQQQQQHHEKGATTTTWVQCDEQFAREKVSQSLRDALHGQYRSSFTAKKQRRTHASDTIIAKVEQVILSNASIARQIQKMTHDLLQCSSETTSSASFASSSSSEHNNDSSIFTMLSLANLDILESLKKDSSLLSQFQKATCC